MISAFFCFHAGLNDFLPAAKRETFFPCSFEYGQSVKHLIEALGVPHTEVHRLLSNGGTVDFGYLVQEGDRVDVFSPPAGEAAAPPELRFVLDNHLGRLAAYLRMLGFDTLYRNDIQDQELAEIAAREARILLTRDRRLLMRKTVQYGYCVRSLVPGEQLREVAARYRLSGNAVPFRRCLRCNHPLRPVRKEEVLVRLEPLTRQFFEEFHLCPSCNQVYWKGSHWERMVRIMQDLGVG
jgi:uncharacterized protein with PIN domain